MDNKIQNIVLKSVMGLIILLGTLFTIWVVMSGDPGNMSDVELEQLAIQKAKAENLQEFNEPTRLGPMAQGHGKRDQNGKGESYVFGGFVGN